MYNNLTNSDTYSDNMKETEGKSPYTRKSATCKNDYLSKQYMETIYWKFLRFFFFTLCVGLCSSMANQNEG